MTNPSPELGRSKDAIENGVSKREITWPVSSSTWSILRVCRPGDTWSEGGAMIIARSRGAGGGTVNAGIVGGGLTPSRVANTEHYDGTAWSAGGSMIIARALMSTGGVADKYTPAVTSMKEGKSAPFYFFATTLIPSVAKYLAYEFHGIFVIKLANLKEVLYRTVV